MIPSTLSAGVMPRQPFMQALPGLLFLVALFFLNFTCRVIFAPLLPVIERELVLDHTAAGSFFFLISAGYFVSILTSGFVSSVLGHKKTIVLSMIASGVAVFLLGFCNSILLFHGCLVLIGLATGLYLPSGLATISHSVSPEYWARGMAIHELAPNIGFFLAPFLGELMLSRLSWREGIQWLGVSMVILGLFYLLRAEGCPERGQRPDVRMIRKFFILPQFWLLVILFALAICSSLGVYAMLPLFLVSSHGMASEEANTLVAISRTSSIVMPLLAGWFGDTFGNRPVIIGILFLTGITTIMLGVSTGRLLVFFIILQPMLAVCFFPSGFTVLTGLGPAGHGNAAVSFCIPFAFLLGGGVMPTLIGAMGDHLSMALGFITAGVAMTAGGILAFFTLTGPPVLSVTP
jgi:MFS transporter, NNP family, nitrate/nitrite transporter